MTASQPRFPSGRLALAAGVLAGLALDTARRSAKARRDYPAHGRFVDVDGGRIHVVERGGERGAGREAERGDMPTVVLVHGAGIDHADMLMTLMAPLASRYRVLAVDRPGIGHSTRSPARSRGLAAPDAQARMLREAVARLGIRRPILVGHSFGAAVALAWGLQFPDEVAGVVFLSGYVYPTTRPDFLMMAGPAMPLLGPVLAHTVLQPVDRLILPALVKRVFSPQPVPDYFFGHYPSEFILQPAQLVANAEDIGSLMPFAARFAGQWPDVRVPLAILAGTEDKIASAEDHAVRLHDAVADSTLTVFPGIGHMVHHFRVGDVVDAVDAIAERADVQAPEAVLSSP